MPTKTEQADLLMAMHGRHGEAPLVVLAAATPADCFHMAFEAVRLAIKYMTPVLLLSDSFLANGAEPWRIVDPDELPDLRGPRHARARGFCPLSPQPETLARPWVAPGTPGMEHRIGGLEKEDVSGAVSYDAANHQRMVNCARKRSPASPATSPRPTVSGPRRATAGGWLGEHLRRHCRRHRGTAPAGRRSFPLHLRYLNPLPANLAAVLAKFKRFWLPENNMGHLFRACSATDSLCAPSACTKWKAGRSASARSASKSKHCWIRRQHR